MIIESLTLMGKIVSGVGLITIALGILSFMGGFWKTDSGDIKLYIIVGLAIAALGYGIFNMGQTVTEGGEYIMVLEKKLGLYAYKVEEPPVLSIQQKIDKLQQTKPELPVREPEQHIYTQREPELPIYEPELREGQTFIPRTGDPQDTKPSYIWKHDSKIIPQKEPSDPDSKRF